MQLQAALDLGVPSGTNPNTPPYCYTTVTSSPGGTMTWAAGGINGTTGTWTSPTYTPAAASGRRTPSNITATKRAVKNGNLHREVVERAELPATSRRRTSRTTPPVSLQYLWVTRSGQAGRGQLDEPELLGQPVRDGRARAAAQRRHADRPADRPSGSEAARSQTQALDCGSGAGPNGWRGEDGQRLRPHSVNTRDGRLHDAVSEPGRLPDCIASENGNFNDKGVQDRLGRARARRTSGTA